MDTSSRLSTIQAEAQEAHRKLIAQQATSEFLRNAISEKDTKKVSLEQKQRDLRLAAVLVEQAATEARMGLKQRFEEIVTAALRSVFGSDYSFVIQLEEKKNATYATFGILSDQNQEVEDPLFARGGSTVDVCAIALRLIYMEVAGMPGPLILDEPGKNISEIHRLPSAEMILELQRITGRQIILVTHHQEFKQVFPATISL